MEPSAPARGYDLFKLFVAIILLILFLLLTWKQAPQTALPPSELFTSTPLSPTENLAPTPTTAPAASSSPVPAEPVTPTSASQDTLATTTSTATAIPISSPTKTNTPASTAAPADTSTALPDPTATQVIESTTTPLAAIPPLIDVCEAAISRSRLGVGMSATILHRLNFRSSPGLRDNWLLTNIPGTRVEIVAGPECIPYFIGAYLWWQIQLPDGQIGWSAEASMLGVFYFMEPGE